MSEENQEMEEKQEMLSQEVQMNEVAVENEGREDDRDARSKGKAYLC